MSLESSRDTHQAQPQKSMATSSTLISRNVTVSSHRTSIRLEPAMWDGLTEIGRRESQKLNQICTNIAESKNENTSLTAAIRVFIMSYFREAATEEGHQKSNHGSQLLGRAIEGNPLKTPFARTPRTLPASTSTIKVRSVISENRDRAWG